MRDFTQEFNQNSTYKLYSYFGRDCFFHLSKVTSGIDSAIFAETEIQGQVKKAYIDAQAKGKCNKELHFLFQKSLKIGKEVRQSMQLGKDIPNLISTTRDLIEKKVVGNKILFVGASETNLKVIKELKKNNFKISITNRTNSKARSFAESLDLDYLDWDQLDCWNSFDAVVCATNCPDYLLSLKKEITKRMLILDLSVPRDVDPRLGQKENITLFNIDQVNKMVRKKRHLHLPHHSALTQRVFSQVCTQHQIFRDKNIKLEKLRVI